MTTSGRTRVAQTRRTTGAAATTTLDKEIGIQSIARAFALLESVARATDGAGLSDLSRTVGLHSSTTFNLLRSMVALGYLWQSDEDRRYRIGRPLLCLAAGVRDDLFLVTRARSALDEMSRTCGEAGTLAVWAGSQISVLAKSPGAGVFQLAEPVGPRPAHATATGKIMLASLSEARLRDFFASTELVRFTSHTITEKRRFRDMIEEVRRTGVAFDNAEFHDDLRCIAVPVHDFSGRTVGALAMSGPVWRMEDSILPERIALLKQTAERLSAELGNGGMTETYSPALLMVKEGKTRKTSRTADVVKVPAAPSAPGAKDRRARRGIRAAR
jgi:DNA-binding IclR family transcriptional regulator